MKEGQKKKLFTVLKILTGIALSWILVSKLRESATQFDLQSIKEKLSDGANLNLLLLCILLMPVNWMLESLKWKLIITATIERISFYTAFKSVMSGVAFGNLAPGRATEFAGKILFIPSGHRIKATYLHFVSGSSQLIVTLLGGMAIVLFNGIPDEITNGYRIIIYSIIPVLLLLLFLFYFNSSYLFSKLSRLKFIRKISEGEIKVKYSVLLNVFFLSVIRYIVFGIQFLLVASIFFTANNPLLFIPGICLYYLFSSIVPMISVIEALMRGGIAVLVFAYVETSSVAIFICSTLIWIINVVVPSVAGYLFFLFYKPK
jgi:hypothetical protein